MPKNHPTLTAERLRQLLSYDPQRGQFCGLTVSGGKPVGSRPVRARGLKPPVERGVAAAETLGRLSECRKLCISGDPHTEQSLALYNAERAREYDKAAERRAPHPQMKLPGAV